LSLEGLALPFLIFSFPRKRENLEPQMTAAIPNLKALVMVPTYNEKENISAITQAILKEAPEGTHVLVVDDGSPDGTGKIADDMAAKDSRIHVLHRAKKMGLGPAYIAGMKWGLEHGAPILIEMDADFSHKPEYLKTMISALNQYDSAYGSRYVPGGGTVNWSLLRKFISRGGSLYARTILGAPINDFTGGFNAWKREVLEGIGLDTILSNGYSFQIELKYRAYQKGYKHLEIPILFEDRRIGKSKMSGKIVREAMGSVWRIR
jgi:dolichol-phosphate mannosyltransferase